MNDHLSLSRNDVDYLLSPLAIRDRAKVIFDLTVQGKNFVCLPSRKTSAHGRLRSSGYS